MNVYECNGVEYVIVLFNKVKLSWMEHFIFHQISMFHYTNKKNFIIYFI